MPGCSAYKCSNSAEKGFLMKVFPRDPVRRAIWATKLHRDGWTPTNCSFLCETHFDSDQWEKTRVDGSRKLKCNAVPTLFSHIKIQQKKRKTPTIREYQVKRTKLVVNNASEPRRDYAEFVNIGFLPSMSTDHTHSDILSASCQVCKSCNDKELYILELQNKLNITTDLLNRKNQEVIHLQGKINLMSVQLSRLKHKTPHNKYALIWNKDQLQMMEPRYAKCPKWSSQTVKTALGLKFVCGNRGYERLLQMHMPFPSSRTLSRRLQNLQFTPGILHEVFDFLKIKVATLGENERDCVLILDEMAIKQSIDYDVSSSTFMGRVTLPDHTGLATKALVFMIAGISTRWKQTVAYYFTGNSVKGYSLKPIADKIIVETERLGLHVHSITSDMGSQNQGMWKAFGIACGRFSEAVTCVPHPCDPGRHLHFMADPPHILKRIRISLLSNKTLEIPDFIRLKHKLPSTKIESKYLSELVDFQESMDLKLAHKLTPEHLNARHFDKMKVSRATHVISHDVSCALKFLAEEESDESKLTTAWFIELVKNWFDLVTSRNHTMALSRYKMEKYSKNITFLHDVIEVFEHLAVVGTNGHTVWKPFQAGLVLTTKSLLKLQDMFLGEKKYRFLLTSRFSQDCIENLFSTIRIKLAVPSALQFKNNLKLISVAQFLNTPQNSSYDIDEGDYLEGFVEEIEKKKNKGNTSTNTSQSALAFIVPSHWDQSEAAAELTSSEKNCLYYIAGYLLHTVEHMDATCKKCLSPIISTIPVQTQFTKLVALKEYKAGSLVYPTGTTFEFFLAMEKCFRSVEDKLMDPNTNCKQLCVNTMKYVYENAHASFRHCHNIQSKIQNRFINFRLRLYSLKRKRLLAKEKRGKSLLSGSA